MHQQEIHTASGKLSVASCGRIDIIALSNLIRIEALSNYSKLVLSDGHTLVVAKVLKKFAEQLDERQFVRTHKTHLVNLNFVRSYYGHEGKILELTNGDTIAVSRSKQKALSQRLLCQKAS